MGTAQALSLEEAVAQCLRNQPRLKEKQVLREREESRGVEMRGRFLPQVALEASAATYKDRVASPGDPNPRIPRERNQYSGQIQLKQSLFAGFADVNAVGEAKVAASIAALTERQTAAELRRQTIEAYFGVLLAQAELEAERDVRGFRERRLQDVRNKLSQGRATKLEQLQAEVSIASQAPTIEALSAERDKRLITLTRLVGAPVGKVEELSDSLAAANAAVDSAMAALPPFDKGTERLLDANFELRMAAAEIRRSERKAGELLAAHLPSLDLVLSAGSNAHLRTEIGTRDSMVLSGELQLRVPLFSGLSGFEQRKQAVLTRRSYEQQLLNRQQELLEELQGHYRELQSAALRVKAEGSNMELAKSTMEQSQVLYSAGRGTLVDLLDALQQFATARRSQAKAMFDRVGALTRIQNLLAADLPQESRP